MDKPGEEKGFDMIQEYQKYVEAMEDAAAKDNWVTVWTEFTNSKKLYGHLETYLWDLVQRYGNKGAPIRYGKPLEGVLED
jgi:hypothetical protein